MKNKKLVRFLLIALALVAAGVVFSLVKGGRADAEEGIVYEDASESGADETSSGDESASSSEDGSEAEDSLTMVCVYVCGAVNDPGVYYLEEGSRVHEAVELAGGLTDDAAEGIINLAAELTDGEQIYIYTQSEAEELELSASSSSSVQESSSADDGLININTATAEELETLSGIGESKAAAIIAYREENGAFSSIEEITNVSGIGDSTYENIKDYITV